MARIDVSIIISMKNEAHHLLDCLLSLAEQKTRYQFDVHLIDNGSTDNSLRLAKRLSRDFLGRLTIHCWKQRKPGSPAARNYGVKHSTGSVLLFTDADCRFSKNWVQEMAAPLFRKSLLPIAAVGGRTESAYQIQDSPNLWERASNELFHYWEKDRLHAFPAFLPWAPTCNLAVKRSVFSELGGFDENWRAAGYDVDFCWRLTLCGFVLGYAPKAEVHHLRRNKFYSFLKQREQYAFYNQTLLSTYETLLGFSKLSTRKERILSLSRRWSKGLKKFHWKKGLQFSALSMSEGAALVGQVHGWISAPAPNPRLHPSRLGITPLNLLDQIPEGYKHLHQRGWSYWPHPADPKADQELILFRARKKQWFHLNHSAWKIWEIRSHGGKIEKAIEEISGGEYSPEIIKDVDHLVFDLRTRGLLQ